MTEPPLQNAAGEPLPEGVNLFALGVRALPFATCVGATAITLVLWGVQSLVPQTGGATPEPTAGPAFYLLVLGTPAAMALAAATCWFVLRPVESWFRRGGLAMVSAFLSFVVSLITFPANVFFGRTGLLVVTLLFPAAALFFGYRVRRWDPSA